MFFVFFLNLFAFSQASVWDNLTATIAVVEYQPNNQQDAAVRYAMNLFAYNDVAELLREEKPDMIIFPESTLQNDRTFATEVKLGASWNSDPLNELIILSYAAKSHNTYIVVNLLEKEQCKEDDGSKNCKNYGHHFYNTDVVFDRNGTIINKYRKYNLFGESDKDQPETPDQVIVKTDFGVNFGMFTCFDILFKSPAQDILSQDIDGIIFPTMWFSEMPFLTALQAQQMYAQAHDIAVFAAEANNPSVASGGSGVHRGSQGLVVGGIVAQGGTRSFVYKSVEGQVETQEFEDVDTLAKSMDNFELLIDSSVKDFSSWVVLPATGDYENQFCIHESTENELCCTVTMKMTQKTPKPTMNYYTYHVVAFSGIRSFSGVYNGGIELCGVIACLNSSLSSCGNRFMKYEDVDWPLTFEEITITANFTKSENKTQFPNSLLSSIRPIEAKKTIWTSEDIEENGQVLVQRTWSTKEKQDRLLTFAIYGRNFELDSAPLDSGDDDDDNGGNNDNNNDNDNTNDNNNDDGNKDSAANRPCSFGYWLLLFSVILLTKLVMK